VAITSKTIKASERVTGANSDTYEDTLNRLPLCLLNEYGGINSGTSFPTTMHNGTDLADRTLFYRTDLEQMFAYDLANDFWIQVGTWVAFGTYTGDGNATKAITGLGFQPKLVILWAKVQTIGATCIFFKTNQDGLNALTLVTVSGDFTAYFEYYLDAVISLDSDGFTVGDCTGHGANYTNYNGRSYTYIALRG